MSPASKSLLLLFGLCAAAETPITPGSYVSTAGLVDLRSSPGGKSLGRMRSRQFLVIDSLSTGKHRWIRVLGAEGISGWIRPESSWNRTPARFDTTDCPARLVSPDTTEIQEWYGAKEGNIGAVQEILGASRGVEDRDFPPRLPDRLASIPWLRVRGSRGQGWISGMELPLRFHPGDSTTLLRSPFLSRDSSAALPVMPAWRWNGWAGTFQRMADTGVKPVQRRWEIPAMPRKSDLAGATGWMITGGEDTWLLRSSDGSSRLILPGETDVPEILSQRFRDLDGDGKDEWILEVSSSYGDGEILHLLVFDGVQAGDSLVVSSLTLGGSSGESPNDATATWKIASTANGPRVVVRRTERKRSTTTIYLYHHGHLRVAR